jgi:DNA polymerase-3 subunit beta
MKFTIQKVDIVDVLSKVQGLAGRKSNLASTANVLIRAGESEISIAATDLETGFEGFYPAKVESEGSLAINARKFFEIVRDFPSAEVRISEIDNHWIEIGNKNVEYHIVGMNPEEFPDIPKLDSVTFFEMPSSALKTMIERSMIIGTGDDKRAHIIGVYFETLQKDEKTLVRMVTTDGSRLSTVDHFCPEDASMPDFGSVLIPKKGLSEVNKFLESEGTVRVGLKDNHFIVKKEAETIIIRLLEGEFPRYSDIIQKSEGHRIVIDRQTFLMMLKRMSILSSEHYRSVIFHFSKGKLVVNSTNPDIGESKEEIPIEFEGAPIEVAFNPRYFIDAANAIDEANVLVHIVDGEKPCFLEPENDKTYLNVIMPMRI